MTDPLILAHSRAVAAPKRQPAPAPTRHPVHAMCLAMSEVCQWVAPAPTKAEIVQQAHARLSGAALPEVWHKTARAGMRVTVAKKDRHGFPFMPSMKDLEGSSGTVEEIDNADGTAFVQMDGREKYWFDMHSLLPAAEADTPAPTAQQFVCIRAHKGTNDWKVGDIAVVVSANEPDNWRPCDAEGWIAHAPTADAACPVPADVTFEARWPCGGVSALRCDSLRDAYPWGSGGPVGGLRAWRPVVQ